MNVFKDAILLNVVSHLTVTSICASLKTHILIKTTRNANVEKLDALMDKLKKTTLMMAKNILESLNRLKTLNYNRIF